MSVWPHWSRGFRKAPAFNSRTKPAVKAADVHFLQMMQVRTVFAAEHRKRAGDLRLCLFMVVIMNQAVTVLGGLSFLLTALWLLLRSDGSGARLAAMAVVFEQHFHSCFSEAAAFGLNPQGSSE